MNVVITADFLGSESDADLVQWLVADGDTVALGQSIVALETAKSTVDFAAPAAGIITLSAAEGDLIEADQTIAVIA
ncbi:hypothetical protein JF66_08820 [Cryobacterium sp. MLB-32]|uniref:biotin/lipoyl-containing protein n=1 Tax=Cryobacterium sp. MLB-32 TaxID=1529318 RepID=UPI0004E64CDE|nr:lipoyl domain-containing protein [Cryobacterium sp. MLB-32]KFF59796.1 hypothetical protein JF66_08820 [Cryobacterium sp. MLB-32]